MSTLIVILDPPSPLPIRSLRQGEIELNKNLPIGTFFTHNHGKCRALAHPVWVSSDGSRTKTLVNAVILATGDCIAITFDEPLFRQDPRPGREPALRKGRLDSEAQMERMISHGSKKKPFLKLQEGIRLFESGMRNAPKRRVNYYEFETSQLIGELPSA